MKSIYLFLIYVLLFTACDPNDPITEDEAPLQSNNLLFYKGKAPSNTSNVYDYAGDVYSDIFSSYYDLSKLPNTVDSMMVTLQGQMANHPYFSAMPLYDYQQFSIGTIDSIVEQPNVFMIHALNRSPLSVTSKVSFEHFLDDLFFKIHLKDGDIHNFILDYETSVIGSRSYTTDESAFILTVTSIARHSIHKKDKKKKRNTDPDWDWLTTCVVGSMNGAVYGMSESIDLALRTSIISD